MYSYNNMANYRKNMYQGQNLNNQRFGGFFAPLLLGGVAGYAIGNTTNKPNYYPYPYYYQYPYPIYYNNNYYYNPYN